MNERTDRDVEQIMSNAFATEQPSDDLTRRLENLARQSSRRTVRVNWMPRMAAVGACALVLAIGALTLTPSRAAAKTFESVRSAVQQVSRFQLTVRSREDRNNGVVTIVGLENRFVIRTENQEVVRIDADGMQVYDPDENTVLKFSFGPGNEAAQEALKQMNEGVSIGLKELDIKKILTDYERRYGKENIRISGIYRDGNRDVYRVDLATPSEPQRVQILADAQTDLPIRMTVERQVEGRWSQESDIELKFGAEVDPKLLDANIPPSAKKIDFDWAKMMGDGLKH